MTGYSVCVQRFGEKTSTVSFASGELTIGRSDESDIVICDSHISRNHARLKLNEDALEIVDLGSRNGVLVNGAPIQSAQLKVDDVVTIGTFNLIFERFEADKVSGEFNTSIPIGMAKNLARDLDRSDSGISYLSTMFQITQLLGQHVDLEQRLLEALDLILQSVPATRSFILVRYAKSERLKLKASLSLRNYATDPPISKTLLSHVMHTKSAVLTANAKIDPRFHGSGSIFRHGIEAAICVPLYANDAVVGVIYVDSAERPQPFTSRHLRLLSILGQIIGTTIDNEAMHTRELRNTRLAAIGEAVNGITHDMRNLVTAIMARTELLQVACEGERWEKVSGNLAHLISASERLHGFTGNLGVISNENKLNLSAVNLGALTRQSVALCQLVAEKAGVALDAEVGEMLPINGDENQLHRVLLNLIYNAIHACSDTTGSVKVRAYQNEAFSFIEVQDSGVGIADDELDKIMEPFYSKKGSNGTGLGLAVSLKIVRQHGGSLRVQSELGVGTTFTVMIPRDTAAFTPVKPA